MARNRTWLAARAATEAAKTALEDHEHRCEPCATPRMQRCPAGRNLLERLWICQAAQSEAWHNHALPADQPLPFGEDGA